MAGKKHAFRKAQAPREKASPSRKRKLGSPVVTLVLFIAAASMLLTSAVGGARAAQLYYSETYSSRVQLDNIGVSLLENGQRVSWRDYEEDSDGSWSEGTGQLLSNLLAEGEGFQLGKKYDEKLAVSNSGTIDQYVRVSIYKYWLDKDGKKMTELSPNLIGINLVNQDKWLLDTESSTEERTVLYYKDILKVDETTAELCDSLTVNGAVASKVSQKTTKTGNYTTITTTYDYDGVQFWIEAQVDAVQTHNAADAIRSAWGRGISVGSDGSLSLE